MKRLLATFGLLALLPGSVSAASTLYQAAMEMTRREMLLSPAMKGTVEKEVETYVIKTLPKDLPPMGPPDIEAAVRKELWRICTDTRNLDAGYCVSLGPVIENAVRSEEIIRTLGRDLQVIAASYEMPVDGYPGRETALPTRYASLESLWRAGSDLKNVAPPGLKDGPSLRMLPLPKEDNQQWKDAKKNIIGRLALQTGDERTGAVFRYRFGYRYVEGKRTKTPPRIPANVEGTERQYLYKRWDGSRGSADIEGGLRDVWLRLKDEIPRMKPPLKPGEAVFFPAIELGIPDVTAWVFFELCTEESPAPGRCEQITFDENPGVQALITGDAGLVFRTPTEPVLPSLMVERGITCAPGNANCPAIRGGLYPPEHTKSEGLCSFPSARAGYLCRGVPANPGGSCEGTPSKPPPNTIVLGTCVAGAEYVTEQGPNVCRDLLWRNPVSADDNNNSCVNCSINFQCQSSCLGEMAYIEQKKDDGTINMCINRGAPIPYKYVLMHELVHAQQECRRKPNTDLVPDLPTCCLLDSESNATMCEALTTDGLLKGSGITTEECARALTNKGCTAFGVCYQTLTVTPDRVLSVAAANAPAVKQTCEESYAEKTRDPRVQALLDGLLGVSNAACETTYRNTIGNNMCYMGQMVEEALEEERLIPGRTPSTLADEIAPWDMCESPDPAFGTFLTPPPTVTSWFPAYRPALLLRTFERALCQINGLPPYALPIQCTTDAGRRLGAFPLSPPETAKTLLDQMLEAGLPTSRMQDLGAAYGTRLGTQLYAEYLKRSSKTLSEITESAAELLGNLADIEFTDTMCPENGATDPLIDALKCQTSSSSAPGILFP